MLWTLLDHQNTVRDLAVYDAVLQETTIANHRTFDSFGNLLAEGVGPSCVLAYTARPLDPATGLQNNLNRWYDAAVGRWLSEDPIGFEGGDDNLYRYCGNEPVSFLDSSGLYGQDVHFYFNYYLARHLGLTGNSGYFDDKGNPLSDAYIIAWMAQHVDDDAVSGPFEGVNARSRFHFPDPDNGSGVIENDPNVRDRLRRYSLLGDAARFGVYLHIYQDTYAHQGWGDAWGHAKGGHKPDIPHQHRASDRDKRMAKQVYLRMEALARAKGVDCSSRSFEDFWQHVGKTLYTASNDDNTRNNAWQQLIQKDFGVNPVYGSLADANQLMKDFRIFRDEVTTWY